MAQLGLDEGGDSSGGSRPSTPIGLVSGAGIFSDDSEVERGGVDERGRGRGGGRGKLTPHSSMRRRFSMGTVRFAERDGDRESTGLRGGGGEERMFSSSDSDGESEGFLGR